MLEHPGICLVIAGGAVRWAPGYAERVRASIETLPPEARERVVRVGYVDDVDRRGLLSGAEILAYPSLAEGFGFPLLEGFAANVPVLTSNTSSLPEVAGDAAVLVDPRDPAAIAAGLTELLEDDDLRNVVRRGRHRAGGRLHLAALGTRDRGRAAPGGAARPVDSRRPARAGRL